MGSEKYPKENDFDDYLGRHGGESNAWTDCEKVCQYYGSIAPQYVTRNMIPRESTMF